MVVSKYEDPYQPTSFKESKTVVILGMAVAIMVLSRATTKVERQRPKVRMAKLNDLGYFDSSSSPGAPSVEAVAVDSVRTSSFPCSPCLAEPVSCTTSFSFPDEAGLL